MNPILNQNAFFVKEHVGLLKAANNYDILEPESGETILHCREEKLGAFTKILRFTDYKRMTPFDVEIKTPQGEPVALGTSPSQEGNMSLGYQHPMKGWDSLSTPRVQPRVY